MTKSELTTELFCGKTISELFQLRDGQECIIFKTNEFIADDNICYIPDLDLNHIPTNVVFWKDEIEEVVSCCYTGNDFVEECGGDEELAERLFWYCDWQHPCSAIDEVQDDDDVPVIIRMDYNRADFILGRTIDWLKTWLSEEMLVRNLFSIGFAKDELLKHGFSPRIVSKVADDEDDEYLPF